MPHTYNLPRASWTGFTFSHSFPAYHPLALLPRYTTKFLQPTSVLELPIESEILGRGEDHLPNAQYSSDHVALLAEFQYTRNA